MRISFAFPLVFGAALAAAACSSSSSDSTPAAAEPTPAERAEATFWTAFNTPDYGQSQAAVDQLSAVHDQDPSNLRNTTLLGAASLWRVAESGRARDQAGAVAQASGPAAFQAMSEVHQRDPSNTFATGFLGIMMFDTAFPKQDEPSMQQGEALMAQAAAEQPTFGLALPLVSAALQDAPGSPRLQHAIDSGWKLLDACIGTTLDRKNPDISPYLGKAVQDGWARFCWETKRAPHSLRYVQMLMGDALLKQGDVATARVFYANAKMLGSHAFFDGQPAWPHEDALDERLGSDLDARAATFATPDRSKWAPVGAPAPFACTMCHGSTTK